LTRQPTSDSRFPIPVVWRLRERDLALSRPVIVAILNVTPDSFSDGGRYSSLDAAIGRVEEMLSEGADVIDIGGESTRPGASRITEEDERHRVLPVLRELRRRHPGLLISVDTTRSAVAKETLNSGADIINDVSGLRLDSTIAGVVAEFRAGLVVVHSRGGVEDMATYTLAKYGRDVVAEVAAELALSLRRATDAGISREAIVVDPGIGFSKRSEHSLALLRDLHRLHDLGLPIMVGASRKRVIGDLTGESLPSERVHGSVGLHIAALACGARLFRVHDVRQHRQALDMAWRVLGPLTPIPE